MNTYKMIDENGMEIQVGDIIKCFRGEEYRVTGWPDTGRNRIWVEALDNRTGQREFYPSVFKCRLAAR